MSQNLFPVLLGQMISAFSVFLKFVLFIRKTVFLLHTIFEEITRSRLFADRGLKFPRRALPVSVEYLFKKPYRSQINSD